VRRGTRKRDTYNVKEAGDRGKLQEKLKLIGKNHKKKEDQK
jgi:hypothetical protein